MKKYAERSEAKKKIQKIKWVPKKLNFGVSKFDMFLWTSGFQNPLVHTDFDMFVDE